MAAQSLPGALPSPVPGALPSPPQDHWPISGSAEGAAFPVMVKALATLLMAALTIWGVRVAGQVIATAWSPAAAAFLVTTLVVIVACYYWILCSRTTITATHIEQTWLWPKRVALADITQAKFIYLPYLAWLIAPRLVVRVQGRGMFVFHAADQRVLQAFARLSLGPVIATLMQPSAP